MNSFKGALCALLCACLASVPFMGGSVSAFADDDDVSSLAEQLQELEDENEKYQEILDKTESDIADKEEYRDALLNKVEVLNEKITVTKESISQLNDDIVVKQAECDKVEAEIDSQLDALANRLKIVYKSGNVTELEILFGEGGFSQLDEKVELIKCLASSDKEMIDEINSRLEVLDKQKAELEASKTELETQQDTLEADQTEYNELIEKNQEVLDSLYETSEDTNEKLKNSQLESKEIEEKITELYSSSVAADSMSDSIEITPSDYTWPCPGYYYLSSQWNEDRTTYNHGAIDIAGSGIMGADVVAANDGIVVAAYSGCTHNWGKSGSCGCGGGYGNYVLMLHSGGKMTLYGHLSSLTVSVGDSIKQGETIGYVGSTGYSTGAHLHFECRLNGVKYNPMLEYPNL